MVGFCIRIDDMKSPKEILGMLLTTVLAVGASVLHAWMTWPSCILDDDLRDATIQNRVVSDAAIYETSCVFIVVVYVAGQFISRRLGDKKSAMMLKNEQQSHMKILSVFSGGYIIINRTVINAYPDDAKWQSILMICIGAGFLLMPVLGGLKRKIKLAVK